jgi:hypothetical protein
MLNLFGWFRSQVKAACLAGVADAVAELGGDTDSADAVRQLQRRLTLPAPEEADEPPVANGKAKGRRGVVVGGNGDPFKGD